MGIAAEHIAHQPGMALGDELALVEGDDAGRFLAAMLQGVQAQHRQGAGIGMAENAEHAAFLMQRVVVKRRDRDPGRSFAASAGRFEEAV